MPENLIERTPSAYDPPLLIRHLLHTPMAHLRDKEIVYGDLVRYRYPELFARVGRLASGLASLGIRHGDTVAAMDWDSHRYLECFFGVPMMGAVLHTINIRLSPEQILYTINHARDDVILVHDDFVPVLEEIWDRIEPRVRLVRVGDGGAPPSTGLELETEYEQLLGSSDPDFGFGDFDENTRATTFYTTGTTGLPKGVYFSHRQLVLHTIATLAALGWTGGHARFHRDDVYMPITPMFHVHAWGIPYIATMMGVKQVYPGRYLPDTLLALIEREGVTFSHCVPTILHMVLSHPDADRVDLSRWKVIIGGSALPRGLAKRAMELGIDVWAGYGLSETCPVITMAQLDREMLERDMDGQLDVRCRTGRPLPLVDLRVVDEDGNDVPRDGDTTGEVVMRSPWLTQGYLRDPERSEELWSGGYMHTGDIAYLHRDGFLQITDRAKDVIKSGGEWISSLELENIVSEIEGVSEVAAIGVPHPKWGERPLVMVVVKEGSEGRVTPDAVKEHLGGFAERGVISKWAVPDTVLIVDAIDKTSVGKLDKKVLRKKYGS